MKIGDFAMVINENSAPLRIGTMVKIVGKRPEALFLDAQGMGRYIAAEIGERGGITWNYRESDLLYNLTDLEKKLYGLEE